jgi:outer membrane protein OmpA-like peptidoglycan-associated protein
MFSKEFIIFTFSELLLVFLFILLIALSKNNQNKNEIINANELLVKIQTYEDSINLLNNRLMLFMNKTPAIELKETEGYQFNIGSADITPFQSKLSNKIHSIDSILQQYREIGVNTIEIIGHTDGSVVSNGYSNLDLLLDSTLITGSWRNNISFGSNADLGLLRALSVGLFLRQNIKEVNLYYKIYSAAQLILPDGKITQKVDRYPDSTRRRIEIRFTRSN